MYGKVINISSQLDRFEDVFDEGSYDDAMPGVDEGPVGLAEGLVLCSDGRVRPSWAASSGLLCDYYDTEWGRPLPDDPILAEKDLFERLSLEGLQAGLSWSLILQKREIFRLALADFDPEVLSLWDERDLEFVLECPGIIRNPSKIGAVLSNARATIALRDEPGGLVGLVRSFTPEAQPLPLSSADIPTWTEESKQLAKALRKRGFKYVGPKTMYALMQAIGLVDDRILGASPLIEPMY